MQPLIERIYEVMQANNQLFVTAGLQPIETLDLYRGQPLNPEAFEFFETPAIFIGWEIRWKREGKTKIGTGSLDVHIVLDSPFQTGNIFTGYENALKQIFGYELIDAILDGLESETTSKLELNNQRPVDTGVIAYQIFTYQFTTYKKAGVVNTVQVGQDAAVEIVGKQLVKKLNE